MSTRQVSNDSDDSKPRRQLGVAATRRVPDSEREEWEKRQQQIRDFKRGRCKPVKLVEIESTGYPTPNSESPTSSPAYRISRLAEVKAQNNNSLDKKNDTSEVSVLLGKISNANSSNATKSTTTKKPTASISGLARHHFPKSELKPKMARTKMARTRNSVEREEPIDFCKVAEDQLYGMVAQDIAPKTIKFQVQLIEQLRGEDTTEPTNPALHYAEQTLFRLIKQDADPKEIKLQAQIIQSLKTAASAQTPAPTNVKESIGDTTDKQAQKPIKIPGNVKKTTKKPTKATQSIPSLSDMLDQPSPSRGGRPGPPSRGARSGSPSRGARSGSPGRRSRSPVKAKRRRSPSPSPTEYLSDASSARSIRKPKPYLGEPRFTHRVKKFDSKEDKASRHIMHPASEPRAQLPELIRKGNDIEKVKEVSTVHPSYDTRLTNPNLKHTRKINRTNGTRAPDLGVKRDTWARLGVRPDGTRLKPSEDEGQRTEQTGLTTGNLMRLTEVTQGGEERTLEDFINEEYGMDDAAGEVAAFDGFD